jgi:acetyltransferase-like isoleucine patch superfamily enzyme
VICPPVRLVGVRFIDLGQDIFLGPGSWLQAIPRDGLATSVIRIGARCSFAGGVTLSAAEQIEFEDDVIVARNVYISDHSHRFDNRGVPISQQGIDRVKPVRIGGGCWLGQNAVILPGVRIGKGSVVGANSVVREDVPDYSVVAGVPARVIRAIS